MALLAGLLQALCLASPWSQQPVWWLQIVCLAWLCAKLDALPSAVMRTSAVPPKPDKWRANRRLTALRGPARTAFLQTWLFTTAWLAGTFWWLYISMHTYGGMPPAMAALAVLLLAASLATYYALAGAIYVQWRPTGAVAKAIFFGALWLLAELARGQWFTGFPWGAVGYAHVDGPLGGAAAWVGVYGVSALAAVAAHTMATLCVRAFRSGVPKTGSSTPNSPVSPNTVHGAGSLLKPALLAAALLTLPWAAGRVQFAGDHGALDVTLLQGNIAQDQKFQPGSGVPDALAWYRQQMLTSRSALTIAPETAVPLLPAQLPAGYWDGVHLALQRESRAVLVGLPLGSYQSGYRNSALGLRPNQPQYTYDKHHLVPFGEFVPPLFRWFTALMNIPLGDFTRGALPQPSFDWEGQRLAPNICYEDLFGEELAAAFASVPEAPTVLVNMSNIAWFGNTLAIDQHLHISRMRALELQRPMIRATNTGATAIIDHRGRVLQMLPPYTRAALVTSVRGRSGGVTPFAWWASRLGLWPLWMLAAAVVMVGVLRKKRRLAAQLA